VPVPPKPPTPPKPQPKPIQQPFIEKSTLNHISNLPNQILDQHTFIPAKPQSLPQQFRPVNKIPVAAKPVPEKTPVKVTPVQPPVAAKPAVKQEEKPPALNFATLEDLAGVTRTVLKQEFRKNFYTSIINLTAQYGYFQVLAILEKVLYIKTIFCTAELNYLAKASRNCLYLRKNLSLSQIYY
jgi:hypothetical protein